MLLIVGSMLFYCVWRARALSLTHDEALSYMAYANRPWQELFSWQVIGMSANNHLLNSLAMKLGLQQAGAKEWALRWLSMAGAGMYCLGAWALARRMAREAGPWWGAGILLTLLAQPYVLDFFSLARGYGPAMGFGLAALPLLLRRVADRRAWGWGAAALVCGMGSVLSNLAFTHFFLALVLALLVAECARGGIRGVLAWLGAMALPVLVLAWVYTVPVRLLMASNNLFFGGQDGFVRDTVQGLLRCALYAPWAKDAPLLVLAWGLALTVLLAPFIWWRREGRRLRNKGYLQRPFFWFTLLLWSCAAAAVAQRLVLGSLYPIERAALYYIPLFLLWCAALCLELPRSTGRGLLSALALACALHFMFNANLRYSRDWRYDACTKNFALQAARRAKPLFWPAPRMTIAVDWLNAPALAAYLQIHDVRWLFWLDVRDADLRSADYALFSDKKNPRLRSGDFKIIGQCSCNDAALLQNTLRAEAR